MGDSVFIGVVPAKWTIVANMKFTNSSAGGWAYHYMGQKCHNTKAESYGESYSSGDAIRVVFDLTRNTIEFFKNTKSCGIAYRNVKGKFANCHNKQMRLFY